MSKVISMDQAIAMIPDGACVATSGIALNGFPEDIIAAIEESFLATGKPCKLNMIHAAGQGAWDDEHGYQHLAHEGLIESTIAGHLGTSKKYGTMAEQNKIKAWNMPQGIVDDMFHATLKGMPGHITKLGLKTFVDPRLEGGRCNSITTEDIVKVIEIDGEEYLMYKAPKIDIALIKGTTADKFGNISLEEEPLPVDMRLIAMATRACGGKIICQVKYTCERLMTDKVAIPGIFIDAVVVTRDAEKYHRQTAAVFYDPSISGHTFIPTDAVARIPLDAKKVIARRSTMELKPGAIINLGVGAPEKVANVAAEEGCADLITMTSESGAVAGVPMGGKSFGAVQNAWGVIEELTQFDFYDGGGLDVTFLGLAEADEKGNVNVSHFGTSVTGCGGFINISQTTPVLVYCGTFTAGGLKERFEDGRLYIDKEGKNKKFLKSVQQITFSADFANETGQKVIYVTERAVFQLVPEGLKLIEIAPGADLQKDILDQMEFAPIIPEGGPALMDAKFFMEDNFGLYDVMMAK